MFSESQIDRAAKWWTERLAHVTPKNFDNKDTNPIPMMLGMMAAKGKEASPEQLEAFQQELVSLLKQEKGDWLCLGVDYHPDLILATAAKKVGISEFIFPWKTNLWLRDGTVQVADGYGAEIVEVKDA